MSPGPDEAVTAGAGPHPLDEPVAATVAAAAEGSAAFARRLADAGLSAADLDSVAALDALPIMTKDDLLADQHENPPFGGWLADGARPVRVFQSPGPLYEPQSAEDTWRWGPALAAAGIDADDVVMVAFSYHLSPAGAMFEEAARGLGATVLPAGIGNKAAQVTAMHDLGVTAYVGLPSYLKTLLDEAAEAGLSLALDKALVSAEPLPPSLRDRLTREIAVVRQTYGTAESGHLGTECAAEAGFHVPDDAVVQVCDLSTGRALHDDTKGQVVVTLLRTDYPLVRFGVGDLSAWDLRPCPCGDPAPRLRGWLGRVGDAVKVRGMFLHPSQVADVLADLDDIAAHRVVIDRVDDADVLTIEVAGHDGRPDETTTTAAATAVREALRFRAEVVAVDALEGDGFVDRRTWD